MSKEIRINKNNVDLTIHFNTLDELEKQLQENEQIWKIVSKYVDDSLFEKRTIRKELVGICELDNNLIILKNRPKSPLHKVILTIYAYGLKGATIDEVSITTGIDKPSGKIITPTKNRKYFRKLANEKWYLSDTGLELIPKILDKIKEKPHE